MARQSTQRGIALVTVVIVVAIISLLTFELAVGQQIWISHAQNLKDRSQADWVRRSALNYAALMMDRDLMNRPVDHLNEFWSVKLPPYPAEGGTVALKVEDLQGRFNLNSLVKEGKYDPEFGNVFRRLLQHAEVDPGLIEPIVDWLDADQVERPGGAEDTFYSIDDKGYRAANQRMTSINELALIKGVTREVIDKLQPLVCALPESTPININTAPTQVLAALFPDMNLIQAEDVVKQRKQTPFFAVADIKSALPKGMAVPKTTIAGVSSRYFLVTTDVEFGHYYQQTASLMHRPGGGKPTVYYSHEKPLVRLAREEAQ